MTDSETDAKIAAAIEPTLRRIEATRGLYDVLLALKRGDAGSPGHTYSDAEKKDLAVLHRRHLLRRMRELAAAADIAL